MKYKLKEGLSIEENSCTQFAKDDNDIIFSINDLDADLHKGLKCELKHIVTGEKLQACCLNHSAKKNKYFRVNHKRNSENITIDKGEISESSLHKLVILVLKNIDYIKLEDFESYLTNYRTKTRITTSIGNKYLKHREPDVMFNECLFEVVITHEMDIKTRLYYESLSLPFITVRYEIDTRKEVFKSYTKMKLGAVIDDILSRCKLQKPYKDLVLAPYIEKINQLKNLYKKEKLAERKIINYGVMPFGKYKGINFENIPNSYIKWLMNNDYINGKLLKEISIYVISNSHLFFSDSKDIAIQIAEKDEFFSNSLYY